MAALTPDEFVDAVRRVGRPHYDPEVAHVDYDRLCERLLNELGYSAGVRLAKRLIPTRWYA